jgi:hypothetical protein
MIVGRTDDRTAEIVYDPRRAASRLRRVEGRAAAPAYSQEDP